MAGLCAAALGIVILGCAASHGPTARPQSPDVEAGARLESMPAVVGKKTPGDVSLRFAWPLPVDGRCATIARRIEGSGTQVVRTVSTLRARADGDQVLIDTVDTEIPPDAPATVLPLAETWPAERLVDAQGRLLRVQPLDAGVNAAERTMIMTRLAQRWQSMVSAWAGRSLPLDATYSATAPEQTAEGPVRLQIAIRADGRVPCEAGAKEASCVRLRILSQPTAGDVPAVARIAARELLSKDAFALYEPSRVRNFASQTTVVLVTDPDTLLPRRVTERRTLQLRIDPLIGGDGVDLNRQDEVTTACAWQRG
jgi:hypothetical protein